MNALRLAAAAAVVAILTATTLLGSCISNEQSPDCGSPSPSETAADGGPDPCHCDPPPSLNIFACACLSGTSMDADEYNSCMLLYRLEKDAGAD